MRAAFFRPVSAVGASGSSSIGLKLKTTGPIEMESPSLSASFCLMVSPLTRVPFDEPRSSIQMPPSSTHDARVLPRHPGLVEDDVALGGAPDDDGVLVELELSTGLFALGDDELETH